MNAEIAKQWTEVLRSGKYKQGRFSLRRYDKKSHRSTYCCLGVLCELAVNAGIVTRHRDGTYGRNHEDGTLPSEVRKWAGVHEPTGRLGPESPRTLAAANDSFNYDFNRIADLIEQNVEVL